MLVRDEVLCPSCPWILICSHDLCFLWRCWSVSSSFCCSQYSRSSLTLSPDSDAGLAQLARGFSTPKCRLALGNRGPSTLLTLQYQRYGIAPGREQVIDKTPGTTMVTKCVSLSIYRVVDRMSCLHNPTSDSQNTHLIPWPYTEMSYPAA